MTELTVTQLDEANVAASGDYFDISQLQDDTSYISKKVNYTNVVSSVSNSLGFITNFFTKTIDGAYWDNQTICIGVAPSGNSITLTKVQATTIGINTPTLTYNIEERAYGAYNSAGTDIFAADKVADSDGDEQTAFSNPGISNSAGLFLTTAAGAESGNVYSIITYVEYIK